MTTVGKILVFVCLVFSLVVGAFSVFIYIAHVNYYDAWKKEKDFRQVEVADAQAWKNEVEVVKADKLARENELTSSVKHLQDDLVSLQGIKKTLEDKVALEQIKSQRAEATATAAAEEVKRRQQDVDLLKQSNKEEMAKNVELIKSTNAFRDRTTAAEILSKATLVRNRELEGQLQEMARDMARIRANSGTAATAVGRSGKNPPPENIDGLVKVADKDGLVKITLGTDAGLARGHTLEVFRLNTTNPDQSKYLGTIRIIEINATEAVGQPVGKMVAPVRPGDTVASRILGG